MVDLSLLQSVSYIAGALGVCVAAVYYVMNLRVQQENSKEVARNRKIAYTTDIMKQFCSKETTRRWGDLNRMQWGSLEDFRAKYDSRVNTENWADRTSFMGSLDVLGYQYRMGLIDLETMYELIWTQVIMTWIKFKPIIDMYRKSDWGTDQFANFEYLARELWKLKAVRDPTYMEHSGGGFRPEEYELAFGKV
jgi:hypothetical protein